MRSLCSVSARSAPRRVGRRRDGVAAARCVRQLLDLCLTSPARALLAQPSGQRRPSTDHGRDFRPRRDGGAQFRVSPSRERRWRVSESGSSEASIATARSSTRALLRPGSAAWRSLGPVGKMEARRLREEFIAQVRNGEAQASARVGRRATFTDVASDWLAAQRALVDVGELAPRTLDGYEISVRRHLVPWVGSRPIRGITANDLVAWHADQRRSGAVAWSIKGRWNELRGVLGHAVRHGLLARNLLARNPADALTSRERPKPGALTGGGRSGRLGNTLPDRLSRHLSRRGRARWPRSPR